MRYEGFDIFIYSKANLDMQGTWSLENDILTYSIMGHSLTCKPTAEDRSTKTIKKNNHWKHELKLKIIDISSKHISYVVNDKKSELIKE
jgi:hypothetical protein